MKWVSILLWHFLSIISWNLQAQEENALIRHGNKFYKERQFEKSVQEYEKAIGLNPANPVANYNLGNAQFRKEKFEEAVKSFDNSIAKASESVLRQQAYYNKGVSFTKQEKLEESIEAYKNALKLNPNDGDARHNLQKALLELRKKQPPKKEEKKENQKKQKEQPKQQSKLNKKRVEELLKALREKEQKVQQKMQENKTRATSQPDKDW